MSVDIYHYLILSGISFVGSMIGLLIHRTLLNYAIALLFFVQAIVLNFIVFSRYISSDLSGHIFSLFMLIVTSLMIAAFYDE